LTTRTCCAFLLLSLAIEVFLVHRIAFPPAGGWDEPLNVFAIMVSLVVVVYSLAIALLVRCQAGRDQCDCSSMPRTLVRMYIFGPLLFWTGAVEYGDATPFFMKLGWATQLLLLAMGAY